METAIINEMSNLSLYNTTNDLKYNGLLVYPVQNFLWLTSFLVIDGDMKITVRTNDIYEYWCIRCRSDHSSNYCKHEIAVRDYIFTNLEKLQNK